MSDFLEVGTLNSMEKSLKHESCEISKMWGLFVGLVALSMGVFASCTDDLPGENARDGSLYYPIDLAASADGHHIYVLNSNFNRRFNSGWVSSVDVDELLTLATSGGDPTDALGTAADGGLLKVLSLAGTMDVQQLEDGTSLGLISHREVNHLGESVLTVFQIDGSGAGLSCSAAGERDESELSSAERSTDCDVAHLLRIAPDGTDSTDPDAQVEVAPLVGALENPFPVALFETSGGDLMAAVGFLTSGWLRLYDVLAGDGQSGPSLKFKETFEAAGNGVGTLREHRGPTSTFLSGTSIPAYASTIYTMDVERTLAEDRDYVWQTSISSELGSTAVNGSRMLNFDFSPDGRRAYAVHEEPDSLVILNAEVQHVSEVMADGRYDAGVERPSYQVVGATPLFGRPTGVVYVDRGTREDLIAVTSFEESIVYFFADVGDSLVLRQRLKLDSLGETHGGVGEGPFEVIHVKREADGRTLPQYEDLLVVASFTDHSLTVIDVSPEQPRDFNVVAKVRNANE